MSETKGNFRNFNIGHLLSIITILGSAGMIYVSQVRELQAMQSDSQASCRRLDALEASETKLRNDIDQINREGVPVDVAAIRSNNQMIRSLSDRGQVDSEALSKIGVMANDIAWIKDELKRRRSADGS